MKKLLLLSFAVLLFTVNAAFAQIGQGTIFAGASSGFSYQSISIDGVDDNLTQFEIDLKGGYFLIDNLVAGLMFMYTKQKFGDSEVSATDIGVFGRYYINGKIFLGAGYASSKQKSGDVESDAIGTIPLEAGYAAFITDNVAVEPSIGYTVYTGDNSEVGALHINLGFALYLNRE